VTTVIEAGGLGKRYGRRWALADCTLAVPAGRVTGLVGPNGAGKTTLLQLAAGLLEPDSGTISVLGERPAGTPAQLGRLGFLAQDAPVYAGLSVAGHLRMGAWLNQDWDTGFARRRISDLGLNLRQRAGSLSGGQRAQLALTLAVAKRPELLLLDEPVASLDPLARREFLQNLMETVAEHGTSVVLSSHLIADIERVCDYLVVVAPPHPARPDHLGNQPGIDRRGPAPAPPSPASAQACNNYIESLHLRQTVTYQPASRYWAFQWTETAIYLALALALTGLSFWWIKRNRSTAPNIRRPRTRLPAPALQNSP
jgi:ABC-type Na+ transport system ATPase subunit NatA